MNVKIALLTLLVALAATTIVATTFAAFNEASSITSIETDFDEENVDYLTLSGKVQPLGDPVGGDWPIPT